MKAAVVHDFSQPLSVEEVFELHRRGEARVLRAQRRLEDVDEAITQVLDGSALEPRLVFDMQAVSGEPVAAAVASSGA